MEKHLYLNDRKFELFISREQIKTRIAEIAEKLKKDIPVHNPVFMPVLNGSFIFAADLLRQLEVNCTLVFVKLESYQGTQSTGKVQMPLGFDQDLEGKHIYIVEDIADSGLSLNYLLKTIEAQNPSEVKIISLLFKPDAYRFDRIPDYTGFSIPNDFVVGYGLDYNGLGRNLPDIYKISE